MQIYEALKKDHEKVRHLLKQLVSLNANNQNEKAKLVTMIRDELVPHSRAEEAVFYNSLRLLDESKSLAMHGYKEHLEAESLLRTLQLQDAVNMNWKDTALKLQEVLEHHIEDEEDEMFPVARGLFTAEEAVIMNEAFQKMKPEIKEEGFVMTTLEMIKNMMPPRLADAISEFHMPIVGSNKKEDSKNIRR